MFKVVKRDGEVADFDLQKIGCAIEKAFDATQMQYNKDMVDLLNLRVTADFQKKIKDDKIDVESIQDSVETVLEQGLPHGKLCIGFTPDEEIGEGADLFDIPGFGADFAYTVDGGDAGSVEYENFNAAAATI